MIVTSKNFHSRHSVSIIICTRNRDTHLAKTLEAFHRLDVPSNFCVELVIVENGSNDNTAQLVRAENFEQVELKYVFEPSPGRAYEKHGLTKGNRFAG